MKKRSFIVLLLIVFSSISLSTAQETINWIPITQLEAELEKEPRPVLIDVYTTWCGWCKRMDQTTFLDPEVVSFINTNYYAVKFDAESKETVSFLGNDFKFVAKGRRGYNELAAALLDGQMSYPSYVFLTSEIKILQVIKGFQDKNQFMPIITYLGEKIYEQQDWNEFMESWNGE